MAEAYLSTAEEPGPPGPEALRVGGDPGFVPLARPLSMKDVEFPTTPGEGEVAYVASPAEASDARQEVVAPQNAVEYLHHPGRFTRDLTALRRAGGYQRMLYTPLLATPSNLPLLIYCGVDLVDVLRLLYDTERGRYHTVNGPLPEEELEERPCLCPACAEEDLLGHNLRSMVAELRRVRVAIRRGDLRELVEQRVANDPWQTGVLREMDYRAYEWQERHASVAGAPMRAYSRESLHRPEVVRFRRRLQERYARPPSAEVLLLLPCSARKPYSSSKSHRLFRSIIRRCGNPWAVHVVVVTSPLGLVPLDLELFHPAQNYDVPVTGDWSRDEVAMLQVDLDALLASQTYRQVVVHLGPEADLLAPALGEAKVTSREKPRSSAALDRLGEALKEATKELPVVPPWRRRQEDVRSAARFQFGPGGEEIVEGCVVKGRYPRLRILAEGGQVAALTPERGMLSLSLRGAERLALLGLHSVTIDDFYPEGNVFAVGVLDADEALRVGDEAVVQHGEEVRAVGVARMNPWEMKEAGRGEAVHVRHRLKDGAG